MHVHECVWKAEMNTQAVNIKYSTYTWTEDANMIYKDISFEDTCSALFNNNKKIYLFF